MGSTAKACVNLLDEYGNQGFFFVFPDLALRHTGTFKLRFDLFDIGR
jgi:Velvet factor